MGDKIQLNSKEIEIVGFFEEVGSPQEDAQMYLTLKGFEEIHPEIKDKLWKNVFWSNSYCLITTGQTTLDQVKKYIENQGN